jgi:protease-4
MGHLLKEAPLKQEKLFAGALVLFCALAAIGTWARGTGSARPHFRAEPSLSVNAKGNVAEIDIQGMIVDSGSGGIAGGGVTSAQTVLDAIDRIRDDGARVLLLNINSPGGTASASQSIFEELMRLKHDKGIHIVASMGDLAASGAYYIACAADEITANPATLTGSIGVIMHTQNLQGLMGKLGVDNGAIKSGAHKDIGSPFRAMSPVERQMLQGIINDTYDQFLNAVATGRKLPVATVRPLADGRIFTGRQALKVHLVDTLGNLKDAEALARKLGGLTEGAGIKNYTEENWRDTVRGLIGAVAGPLHPFAAIQKTLSENGSFNRVPLTLYE